MCKQHGCQTDAAARGDSVGQRLGPQRAHRLRARALIVAAERPVALLDGLQPVRQQQAALKVQVDRVHSHNSTGFWWVKEPGWDGRATVMTVTLDFIFGTVR